MLFGAVGLATILVVMRTRWRFNGRWRAALMLGVVNSGLPFLMYCMAARLLPAGYSAIFNATTPLMGVVVGSLFFGAVLTARKLAGVVVGLGGVALLTATGPAALTPALWLGALACLVATGSYGVAGFLTKRWITDRGGLDAKLVAFGSQVGATLFLLPFFGVSVVMSPPPTWGTPAVWCALAALGIVCTAFAYILYFRLIADIGPIRSLAVTFLVPPFGVLWGALFLGEPVGWAHAAGGALIAVALWGVMGPFGSPGVVANGGTSGKRAG